MAGLSFGKKRRKKMNYELLQEILGWVFQIVLVCFVAFLIVWFFGHKVSMIGDSMGPQLENGDITLINRLVYETRKPRRGEIIAFKPNGNEASHYYIKRVIGLPGETITYSEGKLLIDGEELEEKYETTKLEELEILKEPLTLKSTEYFVLGDDRENGGDSRTENAWNVKKAEIAGKVWFVISPLKHVGFVK